MEFSLSKIIPNKIFIKNTKAFYYRATLTTNILVYMLVVY